ncbi:MAG: putative signal transducing protein, partial [Acidobacteriota bacterium]
PIYAEMLKEMLERQGIPCVLKESFMTSAYRVAGLGASTGHEAILLVPEDRAEEATELLRGFMNGGE